MTNKEQSLSNWTVGLTLAFFFLAHSGRLLTTAFSDDSLEIWSSTDFWWQINLGRYLHPAYWAIRGDLVVPWLIGALAVGFLAASVVLIVRLLGIHSRVGIAAVCLLLTCNSTLNFLCTTFIHELDVYMLSLLLSVLSVCCWRRGKGWLLLAPVLLFLSMGLYQSYLQTAAMLMLGLLILDALSGERTRRILLRGVLAVAVLLLGLALYAAGEWIAGEVTGIPRADRYNGTGNVGNYGGAAQVLALLTETFLFPFRFLLNPETNLPGLTKLIHAALLLCVPVCCALLAIRRRISAGNVALLVLLLALLPLGMNCVYFIGKGLTHSLMIYSYFVCFAFAVALLERAGDALKSRKIRTLGAYALSCGVAFLFFCNMVYGNQLYLRRSLEYDATHALMTRVIGRMEAQEDYVPGETPVIFVGTMFDSPLDMRHSGFEDVQGLWGTMNTNNYALSKEEFYKWMMQSILGYPVNFVYDWDYEEISHRPAVRQMPAFPAKGSVAMQDGILVVKLGATGGV